MTTMKKGDNEGIHFMQKGKFHPPRPPISPKYEQFSRLAPRASLSLHPLLLPSYGLCLVSRTFLHNSQQCRFILTPFGLLHRR